jgi:hypothetical protein
VLGQGGAGLRPAGAVRHAACDIRRWGYRDLGRGADNWHDLPVTDSG